MFKIINILNSAKGTPEPIRISTDESTDIAIGDALTLSGGVAAHCSATATPIFIAASPAKAGKDKSVLAYPVFGNMLFEAPISAPVGSIKVGDKLTLFVNDAGAACGVTASTSGGVATVMDLQGAENAGDIITVKFD